MHRVSCFAAAMNDIDFCLKGEALYGDDFTPEQVAAWHADEAEGYADLGAGDANSYRYGYHVLNWLHGYRHLVDAPLTCVLGFGSAYGDEFLPIASRIGSLTIVDPSANFTKVDVHGVPATYIKPAPDGRLPAPDKTFDLITCLGVLHHIPNVSFVLGELSRVLKDGGYILLREPIVSMGDWRRPRRGLTKRERGIPLRILRQIVERSGLETLRMSLCCFSITPRLFSSLRIDAYNNAFATRLDAALSVAFAWNVRYHSKKFFHRFRPTSAFLVLRKASAASIHSSGTGSPQ